MPVRLNITLYVLYIDCLANVKPSEKHSYLDEASS
jgi:hypothetical protein